MTNADTQIRLIRPEDAAELTRIISQSADHLRPWEPHRDFSFYTQSRQLELIEAALASAESGTTVPFVIESYEGEILGRLTLSGVTRGALQSCALSYWVRADRLRRGHASRAVMLAVVHAFERLELHRIQAETLPENVASQTVLRAAGFSLFGFAPQYLRIDGVWRDHLMFQLLNRAFK